MSGNGEPRERREPPSPADDPADLRFEKLMAYHVGALEKDEAQTIARRIETDPEWERASDEARSMLDELKREGAPDASAPVDLAARTLEKLDTARNAAPPLTSGRFYPFTITLRVAAAVVLAACLPALWYGGEYVLSRPDPISIFWKAEGVVAAGAPYAPNLMVRHTTTGQPLQGVAVEARLVSASRRSRESGSIIGEAVTDRHGLVADAEWHIPDIEPGTYRLVITARSDWGVVQDSSGRDVTLVKPYRLVVSPDRLQARPGETVRARSLLVTEVGSKPVAGQPLSIELSDPDGNRIARHDGETSEYGLGWAEFPLDDLAREGTYVLRALSAGQIVEQPLRVKQYRLPPFRVMLTLDRSWFAADQELTGTVRATTFDGRPVRDGKADVRVELPGRGATKHVAVALDLEGHARFAVQRLDVGMARGASVVHARLSAEVVDAVGRRANNSAVVPVSRMPVVMSAVAEAGELVQGVENRVYLLARRPDGTPVSGRLVVARSDAEGDPQSVDTDEDGVGVVTIESPDPAGETLTVAYHSGPQEVCAQVVTLSVRPARQSKAPPYGKLLIRTDRVVVSAGSRVRVRVFSDDGQGTVTLCLRQGGRTVAVAGVTLLGGAGEGELAVPEGMSGTATVEASLAVGERQLWTDARAVAVVDESRLSVTATPSESVCRPGQSVEMQFRVVDGDGKGVPAAVSVVAVDEALIQLTGRQPGLAQAMHAAAISLFADPSLPIDHSLFADESADSTRSRAALAAAKPHNLSGAQARLTELEESGRLDPEASAAIRNMLSEDTSDKAPMPLERLLAGIEDSETREEVQALVAVQPTHDTLINTGPKKISDHRARQRKTERLLGRVAAGIPVVMVVVFVVTIFWGSKQSDIVDAHRKVAEGVPIVTAAAGGSLFLAMSGFEMSGLLPIIIIVNIALIGGHAALFFRMEDLRRQAPKRTFNTVGLLVGAATCDTLMLMFSLGGVAPAHGRESMVLGVLLFVGGFLAFALQKDLAMPAKERGTGLFVHGLVSIALVGGFGMYVLSPFLLLRGHMSLMQSIGEGGWGDYYSATQSTDWDERAVRAKSSGVAGRGAKPRVRWDFPETLVFAPQIVTDADGRASLKIDLADSITTWLVHADAVAARGGVASTDTTINVTQPFSVDLVLPTSVTAGDVLDVPALVSNHTDHELQVSVSVKATKARTVGDSTRTIRVPAHSVAAVEFAHGFDAFGDATIEVTASAGGQADAVRRQLKVLPDGRPVQICASALVHDSTTLTLAVPDDAIQGTVRSEIRIHRGPLSQIVDGLESILREPYGCFEQTSSATYPNVLVLRYLRATGQSKPKVEARATTLIARGYQRLLGFEVGSKTGSFSLFGEAPASPWLTAYGLTEFTDMAEVYNIDPDLIERMRSWLLRRVRRDGSFPSMRPVRDDIRVMLDIAGTAYVVWALDDEAPSASLEYLRGRTPDLDGDPYLVALVANALAPHDPAAAAHLSSTLRGLAHFYRRDDARLAVLPAERTLAWGYGDTATVEATALGVLALLRTGQDVELAEMLVAGLQERVRPGGGWGSTHATILALKALVATTRPAGRGEAVHVALSVNGRRLAPIEMASEEGAVPTVVTLELSPGNASIGLTVTGAPITVLASSRLHVTWAGDVPLDAGALDAQITYSARRVRKHATVLGTLTVTSVGRAAELPMVEWGLPAGFQPMAEDLDGLKKQRAIAAWEMSGRTLRVYLRDLASGKTQTIPVRFIATAAGTLKASPTECYEYYRRHEADVLAPETFEVF